MDLKMTSAISSGPNMLNALCTFPWKLNRICMILIQKNAFEIVVCQNGGHFAKGEMG